MSAIYYPSVIELNNVEFLDSFSMLGSILYVEETYNLNSWVHFESVLVTQTFDNLLPTISTVLQALDTMDTINTVSLTGNYWIILSGVSEFSLVNSEFSMK